MVAEKKVVNSVPPLWVRSPKKFVDAHKSIITFTLWQLEQEGKDLPLSKFMAYYFDGLPENLPPMEILNISQWVVDGYQAWQSAKKEAVLA